ncbi:MAG TPA: DUF1576 domain-containing protein [Oscillospiraceae bacterium]|nr:DUF1576 domain-containing protein [Oscillospiraceae bacterium]
MKHKHRWLTVTGYMLLLVVIGLVWPAEGQFVSAYRQILKASGVLVSDYFVIGSISAALVNAGLVGLSGLALIYFTHTTLSGPTIAAVFTMAGFALFGKTPLNIWPIFLGVALSAWLKKEQFRTYIVVALFGSALGPVVSQVAFGLGLGYLTGAVIGLLIGIVLPALAPHLLQNHQGFSLYNIGFTCGIIGMFVVALLKLRGLDPTATMVWGSEQSTALAAVFLLYFFSMLILGWKGRRGARELLKLPGTLVTDFVSEQGFRASLFNMGLVGLMALAYIILVGGAVNGPTLGGVFTIAGFGAFGKHPRNCWPLMAGVFIGSHLSVWTAAEPGPLLAALFGTTLAPIAGSFGPLFGMAAGVVHLAVVMHVGIFHAGLNLYNNGFAGGLVGTLFVSLSRWFNLQSKHD